MSAITFDFAAGNYLRLANGNFKGEGRVEIFYNGTWGTICDDNCDMNDAHVVCYELGFSKALSAPKQAWFGAGSGPIWLDNVQCVGTESSLANCRHNGWNIHNCNHNEDASVICLTTDLSMTMIWNNRMQKNNVLLSHYLIRVEKFDKTLMTF